MLVMFQIITCKKKSKKRGLILLGFSEILNRKNSKKRSGVGRFSFSKHEKQRASAGGFTPRVSDYHLQFFCTLLSSIFISCWYISLIGFLYCRQLVGRRERNR